VAHLRPGSDPFYALAEALIPLYTPNLNATERMAQTPKLADYLDKGEVTLTNVMVNIRRSHPSHQVLLTADQFEEIYTLGKFQHQGKMETTRLSPDGKLLATVGENGAAFLWEVNSRSKKELTVIRAV